MKKGQVKNIPGSLPYMEYFSRRNFFISSPALQVAAKIGACIVAKLHRGTSPAVRFAPSIHPIFSSNKPYHVRLDRL